MGKQRHKDGPQSKVFYSWVSLMRWQRPKVILHENVLKFGDAELRELMSDLYVVIRAVVDPATLGWPAHRPRQYCVLVLKSWIVEQIPTHVTSVDAYVIEKLNFCNNLQRFLSRKMLPGYTLTDFMIACQSELDQYLTWMKGRKYVHKRYEDDGLDRPQQFTFDTALTKSEMRRREDYYA
eukprot:9498163-Pyramimonas_sp.AAC.1